MNRSFSAHDLAAIAMSVALIAVCSWISVPTTIPFTMQTFAVCLVAAVFGLRHGVWAVLCYILLGAVGAPVFAGFSGGFGVLLGTTGGYILGFVFTALIVGLAVGLADARGEKGWQTGLAGLAALAALGLYALLG